MITYVEAWIMINIPERIRRAFMNTLGFFVQSPHLVAHFCWGVIIAQLIVQRSGGVSSFQILERVYGIQAAHSLAGLALVGLIVLARAHDDTHVAICALVPLAYALVLIYLYQRGLVDSISVLAMHFLVTGFLGMMGMLFQQRLHRRLIQIERDVRQIKARRA